MIFLKKEFNRMKKVKLFSMLMATFIAFENCCAHCFTVRNPDISEVKTIVKKFKGFVSWNKLTEELVENNIDKTYVAHDDNNNTLAYLRVSLLNSETIHIHDLVTLKEYRGNRIAEGLLNKIKEDYPDLKIELTPTKKSIGFYEKMNFKYLEQLNVCIYKSNQSSGRIL